MYDPRLVSQRETSKKILSMIITAVQGKTKYNQWMNTDAVICWFTALQNKEIVKSIKLKGILHNYLI